MKFIVALLVIGLHLQQNASQKLYLRGRRLTELLPEGAEGNNEACSKCKTEWFDQILDHLESTDNRTWKQKYFINDELFDWEKKTGPVFIVIGGENAININMMSGFHWYSIAQTHKALLLQLEHRYYGESWPLGEDSLKTENLKYLSSQQALKDVANFIETFNKKHELPNNVKWVTWGGSYAGNLAGWSRMMYPDLIFAAITSSAPVLSTVEYPEFFQVVYDAIEGHSKDCAKIIKTTMDSTSSLMKTKEGMKQLNNNYTLCQKLTENSSSKDISNFYFTILEMLGAIVQYNLETIIPQWTQIQVQICNVMANKSMGTPIERLNRVVTSNKKVCIFYQYDATIKFWQNTDIKGDSAGQRSWTYQTCTEFGNLQSTSKTPLFNNLVKTDFLLGECADTFGENFDSESVKRAVDKTNSRYGGLKVATDKIIWTQGSFDPWYLHGITKSNNKESPAFLVHRTSHCQDQFSNQWNDLPEMMEARNSVEDYLSKWLGEK